MSFVHKRKLILTVYLVVLPKWVCEGVVISVLAHQAGPGKSFLRGEPGVFSESVKCQERCCGSCAPRTSVFVREA